MPLRLDIKRKLSARSDRVKCVDLHPTEPWMLASLYNGNVHVWNHESQQLVKSFEVCDLPVRAAKFVARWGILTYRINQFMITRWTSPRTQLETLNGDIILPKETLGDFWIRRHASSSFQLQHARARPLLRSSFRLHSFHRGPPHSILYPHLQVQSASTLNCLICAHFFARVAK